MSVLPPPARMPEEVEEPDATNVVETGLEEADGTALEAEVTALD